MDLNASLTAEPRGVDVGEVDLDHAEGVRRRRLAHHHVVAGELADLRQPHDRVALARRRAPAAAPERVPAAAQPAVPVRRPAPARARPDRERARSAAARARRLGAAVGVDEVHHVLAGDPPAGTGAGDVVGVDAVLVHEPAHDRREQPVVAGVRRRRGVGRGGAGAGAAAAAAGSRLGRRCRRRRSGAGGGGGGGRAPAAGAGRLGRRRGRCRARRAPAARLGRRRRRGAGVAADHRDHGADLDRVTLGDPDLLHDAGHRRRNLGVDLVGGHLEQRLVGGRPCRRPA